MKHISLTITEALHEDLIASLELEQEAQPLRVISIEGHIQTLLLEALDRRRRPASTETEEELAYQAAHLDFLPNVATLFKLWNDAARPHKELVIEYQITPHLKRELKKVWLQFPEIDIWETAFYELAHRADFLIEKRNARTLASILKTRPPGRLYPTFFAGLVACGYRPRDDEGDVQSLEAKQFALIEELLDACTARLAWIRTPNAEGCSRPPDVDDIIELLGRLPAPLAADYISDVAEAIGWSVTTIDEAIQKAGS